MKNLSLVFALPAEPCSSRFATATIATATAAKDVLTSPPPAKERTKSFAEQDPTNIRQTVIGGPPASFTGDPFKIARNRHELILAKNLVEHLLDVVRGVIITVIIQSASFLQHPMQLDTARAHVIDVSLR
jgi:hypothetical protein